MRVGGVGYHANYIAENEMSNETHASIFALCAFFVSKDKLLKLHYENKLIQINWKFYHQKLKIFRYKF